MDVSTHTASCGVFLLTLVPAARILSLIRKQTKIKRGFWKTALLPATGSVDIGEPPTVPHPDQPTHLTQ